MALEQRLSQGRLPVTYDYPLKNVQVAAGPNISMGVGSRLPEGSTGFQRAAGGYTVKLADGTTKDFADEASARAAFSSAPAPAVAPSGSTFTPAAPISGTSARLAGIVTPAAPVPVSSQSAPVVQPAAAPIPVVPVHPIPLAQRLTGLLQTGVEKIFPRPEDVARKLGIDTAVPVHPIDEQGNPVETVKPVDGGTLKASQKRFKPNEVEVLKAKASAAKDHAAAAKDKASAQKVHSEAKAVEYAAKADSAERHAAAKVQTLKAQGEYAYLKDILDQRKKAQEAHPANVSARLQGLFAA